MPAATPPQIISQPTSLLEITTVKPVIFSLQATGTEPLNYQWQWKPELVGEDESETWQDLTCDGVKFQEVKGGLKLNKVQACNAGYYRCVVSNSAGSETSQCANLIVGKDSHSSYIMLWAQPKKQRLFCCSCWPPWPCEWLDRGEQLGPLGSQPGT